MVDVNLLLDNMKSNDTAVGQWVNVIGYVEAKPVLVNAKGMDNQMSNRGQAGMEMQGAKAVARVQAVMLWSAGGIKLAEYERTLAARIAADENGKG